MLQQLFAHKVASVDLLDEQDSSRSIAKNIHVSLHFEVCFFADKFKLLLLKVVWVHVDLLLALGNLYFDLLVAMVQRKTIAFAHRSPVSPLDRTDQVLFLKFDVEF